MARLFGYMLLERVPMDFVDVLLKLVIFATFVVFGLAVWSIKKGIDKQKKDREK